MFVTDLACKAHQIMVCSILISVKNEKKKKIQKCSLTINVHAAAKSQNILAESKMLDEITAVNGLLAFRRIHPRKYT